MTTPYPHDIIRASRDQHNDEQAVQELRRNRAEMGIFKRVADLGRTTIKIHRLEDIMKARHERYPGLPSYMQIIDEIYENFEPKD